jgi:hypothetical protein
MRRHCFPVYWNGENRRVLRGHWFARKGGLDWIPLREDVSEQLELAYNCQVGIMPCVYLLATLSRKCALLRLYSFTPLSDKQLFYGLMLC